jgi:hypothetical protein
VRSGFGWSFVRRQLQKFEVRKKDAKCAARDIALGRKEMIGPTVPIARVHASIWQRVCDFRGSDWYYVWYQDGDILLHVFSSALWTFCYGAWRCPVRLVIVIVFRIVCACADRCGYRAPSTTLVDSEGRKA